MTQRSDTTLPLHLPALYPYYQDDLVTIYNCDSRKFKAVGDVLITDPPYGVDLGSHGAAKDGRTHLLTKEAYASYEDTYANFVVEVVPIVKHYVAECSRSAVWVGPHYHEFPKADAIGGVFHPAASARNRWGFKNFLPILLYGTRPNAGAGCFPTAIYSSAVAEPSAHPVPKPLTWLRWLVGLTTEKDDVIVDPFAGSGTTLRAAKDLGRKAIGIEIEERYCELAATRMGQEALDLEVA